MKDLASHKFAVLGGGGFIGTNLCKYLLGLSVPVKAFGRRKSFPSALEGVEWQYGDFGDSNSLASAIEGCDIIFHLISSSTPASANANKPADLQNNVINTINLLETCRLQGIQRIIFVSSGGTIYGMPSSIPVSELAETNPITAYGISKLAIEKYLYLYEYLYGLEYRVLRVSNPYGPYQTSVKNQGVIASFLKSILKGQPIEIWGNGSIERDYVFIDDVVRALELSVTHDGQERIFNIGSGVGHTLIQLVDVIQEILGRPIEIAWKPGRTIDVPRSILDVRRAMESLRFSPHVTLREGLEKTIAWNKSVLEL